MPDIVLPDINDAKFNTLINQKAPTKSIPLLDAHLDIYLDIQFGIYLDIQSKIIVTFIFLPYINKYRNIFKFHVNTIKFKIKDDVLLNYLKTSYLCYYKYLSNYYIQPVLYIISTSLILCLFLKIKLYDHGFFQGLKIKSIRKLLKFLF